jgi:RNA polymerase sigma factor (sigma-70 family)
VVNQIVTRDALGRLPSRQREVVVLRYLAGLSTAETAEAMGCAEGTVKASLAKALGALRVDMENSDET